MADDWLESAAPAFDAVKSRRVFDVRRIADADYHALPFLARMKLLAHGKRTAYTPLADACQACGLCVVACPESAISLVARMGGDPPRE